MFAAAKKLLFLPTAVAVTVINEHLLCVLKKVKMLYNLSYNLK
jgi:hypothetical protein